MLLNTSFNCQEPIVETPEQALSTFKKTALDILVINDKWFTNDTFDLLEKDITLDFTR